MILADVVQQAQQAIELGDFARAEAIAREVLADAPECLTAHRVLAEACLELGALEVAERHFQRALEIDPLSAVSMLGMGVCAEERGDKEGAHGWFFQAWELNPHFHQVRDELLRLRVEIGGEARIHPSRAGLAAIHARAGQWERAAAEWQSVIELDPISQLARTALATVLWRAGDDGEAATAAEDALLLNAKNAHALLVLAEVAGRHEIDRPEYRVRYDVVDPAAELAEAWAAQMPNHDFSGFLRRTQEVLIAPTSVEVAASVAEPAAGVGSDDDWIGLMGADAAVVAEAEALREAGYASETDLVQDYEHTVKSIVPETDRLVVLQGASSDPEALPDRFAQELAAYGEVVLLEEPARTFGAEMAAATDSYDLGIDEDDAVLGMPEAPAPFDDLESGAIAWLDAEDADDWMTPDLEAELSHALLEPVLAAEQDSVAESAESHLVAEAGEGWYVADRIELDVVEEVVAVVALAPEAIHGVEGSGESDVVIADTIDHVDVFEKAFEPADPFVASAHADLEVAEGLPADMFEGTVIESDGQEATDDGEDAAEQWIEEVAALDVDASDDLLEEAAGAIEERPAEYAADVAVDPDGDRDWPAELQESEAVGAVASGEAIQTADLVWTAEPEPRFLTREELLAEIDAVLMRHLPAPTVLEPVAVDWYRIDNEHAQAMFAAEHPLPIEAAPEVEVASWQNEADFAEAEHERDADGVVFNAVEASPELDRLLSSLDRARERFGADASIVAVEPTLGADDAMLHVKHDADLVAVGAPLESHRTTTDQLIGWRVQLFDDATSAGVVARELEQAIANGRQEPFAYRVLGEAYLHLGQVREAAGQFRQAMLHRTGAGDRSGS